MLQAWLSFGYIVLLAVLVLAFILWRREVPFWPSLHSWWVSPSGLDGNTHVQHGQPASSQERSAPQQSRRPRQNDRHRIHLHAQPVRQGARADQRRFLVVVGRNSERIFNDAKTAQDRDTEMTVMWNRWRSTLFSWYPNVFAIGPAGSWPLWSVRTIIFYVLSVVLWLSYFYAFFRLRRSSAPPA